MSGSPNPKVSGVSLYELLAQMDKGATEVLVPSGISLQINGKSYDGAALSVMLKSMKAPYDKAEGTRVQLNADRKARNESVPETKKFLKGAVKALQNQFDSDPTILTKFGIPEPADPKTRTTKEKAASVEQGQQTKKAREGNKDAKAAKVKISFETDASEATPANTPPTKAAG